MPKKGLTSLEELATFELSAVDAGANKKKRFPITKAKEFEMPKEFEEIIKSVLETEVDEEAKLIETIDKAVSEKGVAALKSALRILSAYKDELPKDALDKLAAAAGYPAPAMKADKKEMKEDEYQYPSPEKKASIKKFLDEMPAEIKAAIGLVEKKKEEEPMPEPKLAPEIEAIVKAHKDEIAEMQKQLKSEQDKRELAEWTEKARTDLAHVPGKSTDELAAMLKSLADVDRKLADAQFDVLKKSSEAMRASEILKSAGSNPQGAAAGSAWEEITKKADGFVEKSAGGMTKEQAIARVLDLYPELYANYLNEHPAQIAASLRS